MRSHLNTGPVLSEFFGQKSTATSISTTSRDSGMEAAGGAAPLPSTSSPPVQSSNPHQTSKTTNTIKSFVSSNPTLQAEICWATKVVTSHYSYKSCENAADIFRTMFPDSDIGKQFTWGERKAAYLATFGIAPHFSSLMKAKIKKESEYVLLFDESLNREIKKSQLDMHVRFWDGNQVKSRYLTSFFMGHHTAEQMHEKVENDYH